MRLTLTEHSDGVTVGSTTAVAYEMERDHAQFGPCSTEGHTLVFALGDGPAGRVLLSEELITAPHGDAVMRCDRIDFPPGAEAHLHTHPGPGIRCQLFGQLTVSTAGSVATFGPLEPWYESGPEPVHAVASSDGPAAFVRVLILPTEWAGKRTIRYVDAADEDKPKLQSATVYGERAVAIA